MGGNREGTELADDMESLLGPFVNVGDVLIIVDSESEVFEVADPFNCLVMDGGGDQSRGGCV